MEWRTLPPKKHHSLASRVSVTDFVIGTRTLARQICDQKFRRGDFVENSLRDYVLVLISPYRVDPNPRHTSFIAFLTSSDRSFICMIMNAVLALYFRTATSSEEMMAVGRFSSPGATKSIFSRVPGNSAERPKGAEDARLFFPLLRGGDPEDSILFTYHMGVKEPILLQKKASRQAPDVLLRSFSSACPRRGETLAAAKRR